MAHEITEIKLSEDEESVSIYFSDGVKLRLSSYDFYGQSFARREGTISDAEFETLLRIEEASRAKNKLISLLSYSGNSRKGFSDKLKKYGFSEESIEYALDFAEQQKLISDENYASALAYELVEIKMYGPIRVKNEMFRHGVPSDITKAVMEKYSEKDERGHTIYDRNMVAQAKIKAKGRDLSDRAEREKLFAALNRLGYEFSRISKLRFTK